MLTITVPLYAIVAFVVALAFLVIITSIIITMILINRKNITNQLNDMNRLIYFHSKNVTTLKNEINASLDSMQSEIDQLDDSIRIKIQLDKDEMNRQIYPTPELAKRITDTIEEQLAIQFVLNKNKIAPSSDALNIITEHTIKTYPHVSKDYLIPKVIAGVEQGIYEHNQKL